MKKIITILALFLALSHTQSYAQIRVNSNIGSQPVWGPAGYDYAEYYYLPDCDMYYHVGTRQWIYRSRGRWISTSVLPGPYRKLDLYRSYKVVINDRDPYRRADYYRSRYTGFRGRHDQIIIRDSRDRKYFAIKDHPRHQKWNDDRRHGSNKRDNDHHDRDEDHRRDQRGERR